MEHAELNQRVEVGEEVGVSGELPGPGADGTGADGTASCLGQHGLPSEGRQAAPGGPTGLGGCTAHGGQRPAGAQPYLASMPESWAVVARLSPGGRQLPPKVWVLGA